MLSISSHPEEQRHPRRGTAPAFSMYHPQLAVHLDARDDPVDGTHVHAQEAAGAHDHAQRPGQYLTIAVLEHGLRVERRLAVLVDVADLEVHPVLLQA